MGSTFNPQILVEKLAKLNSSQASIETLSHWCIFHMNKARQVVETWDRQFHCAPRDQRLAFLYLANDILQNSRRKGSEFVAEFWKVLPDALRDVIDNGDEVGRNAALRLVGIWEERKVFGSRGQILKEELAGRHLEKSTRNGKQVNTKLKHSAENTVDKLVSGYEVVYGQGDEEMILSKCRSAINCVEKVEKEIGSDANSGQFHGSRVVEEVQGQHSILRGCVEQLTRLESSRATLVSLLREALREQEFKLDQLRNQLQTAQSQSEQATSICRQLLGRDHPPKQVHRAGEKEQSVPVMYAQSQSEEDPRKSAAAAMAAKLTASTSSAQMLSYVLSSLASEGVIGNTIKESSGDYPPEKRPKLDNNNNNNNNVGQTPPPPPPPSSSPPPLPPPPPMPQYQAAAVPQFMQSVGYSYAMTPPTMPCYSPLGNNNNNNNNGVSAYTPTPNSFQAFQQAPDGTFYNHPSSMPMAPISRQ